MRVNVPGPNTFGFVKIHQVKSWLVMGQTNVAPTKMQCTSVNESEVGLGGLNTV